MRADGAWANGRTDVELVLKQKKKVSAVFKHRRNQSRQSRLIDHRPQPIKMREEEEEEEDTFI